VARELALVKVKADGQSRSEIIQLVEIFGAEISDVTADAMTIQITGSAEQLVDFEELMRPFGLIELVKTGVVALGRGSTTT
jgi:acetolactate synthase-1/3 small subunit